MSVGMEYVYVCVGEGWERGGGGGGGEGGGGGGGGGGGKGNVITQHDKLCTQVTWGQYCLKSHLIHLHFLCGPAQYIIKRHITDIK